MPFTYQCTDGEGRFHDGVLDSLTAEEARQLLADRGWQVLVLSPIGKPSAPLHRPRPAARPRSEAALPALPPLPDRLKSRLVATFMLQLATLLNAGVPLEGALRAISDPRAGEMASVSDALLTGILSGKPLSRSMAEHGFRPTVVNLINVGESSGALAEVMLRLSATLSNREEQRSRLLSALADPTVILLVTGGMVAFLVFYMLPQFLTILSGLESDLPWPTKVLLWLNQPLLLIPVGLILLLVPLWWGTAGKTPAGRLLVERLTFESPLVGHYSRQLLMAGLARTLAQLLDYGVPFREALKLLYQPTCGYLRIDRTLAELHRNFTDSGDLEGSLLASELPDLMSRMLITGAETGRLSPVLEHYANLCEMQAEMAFTSFMQALEPALVGVMGMAVAGVVLAAFLPIFQVISKL